MRIRYAPGIHTTAAVMTNRLFATAAMTDTATIGEETSTITAAGTMATTAEEIMVIMAEETTAIMAEETTAIIINFGNVAKNSWWK